VKRRHRLSRSRDFDAVYRKGRSVSTRYLVLYAFPREAEEAGEEMPGPRLGLAVSRKVGGAVARNRLKRRLREIFDGLAESVRPGYDYVLVARPGLAEAAETREHAWLVERVSEVFRLAEASPQEARA
jgi:ribonuclease P protein component